MSDLPMRWQQKARIAIAAFVIVFAAVVFLTMRQRTTPPAAPPAQPEDRQTVAQSLGPIESTQFARGKLKSKVAGKDHKVYRDGRIEISSAILTVPDRDGRPVTIGADKAEVLAPPGQISEITRATFTGNVRLTTETGISVAAARADYNNASGMVNVPGAVEFSRDRMTGTGVGATYDKNRDVVCLLQQPHIVVAPDASGSGGADATAGSACMSRGENYVKLTANAHIVGEGRTLDGDEITARLTEDGQTIRQLELRGNSRITGAGASTQNMSARDIDLTYAPGGRVLETARLVENAVVELPASGTPGRRIAGRTIDMRMSPDGTTLTSLNATDSVQVDLPGAGDLPAKRIRAQTLVASGPPGAGLQNATFTGAVEYHETRGPHGKLSAIDRTAHANRLVVTTKPGLGDVERADFFGSFNMTDGEVSAEAPRAFYFVNGDKMELSAGDGEPGPVPFLRDKRMRVNARHLQFSPSTRRLTADTEVQSTMQPERANARKGRPEQPAEAAATDGQPRMPGMLKKDRPVSVVAHRLEYDGVAEATYTGQARLWQDQSKIDAETIVLNDRTGNLTARTNVRTAMLLEDKDPKTNERSVTQTIATADKLDYDDEKRLAVYTGTEQTRAHMQGVHGDVTANRIDVYLSETGDQLERAVAVDKVVVKEARRTVTGARLVYTAENDTYVMTGNPVEAFEQETPNSCKITVGSTLTFQRAVGSIRAETSDLMTVSTKTIPSPCPAERRD